MAATIEQTERAVIDTLQSLTVAERSAEQLEDEAVFDIACALSGAREALERALTVIAETVPQAREVGA